MKINIEALISAPISKVWMAWTQPDHITKWNFAIPEWHCPRAKNDLRVGGKYEARMEAKDGSFGFDFIGLYDEVVDQKKLSYVLEDGRRCVTEFESVRDQTKVLTTFDAEDSNPIDMQKQGWQSILDNFKKYVESNF